MMRSEGKITRENAYDLIKQFAKQYRKQLGKVPGEIIFVGGGSIMLNYNFRDSTQDFDVILKTVSGIRDVIACFADENGLPDDWMNSDFIRTSSYSDALPGVSKYYASLNNGTLEIRTVKGVYLIAMKLRARRGYRNDISDAIGILAEEKESGNDINCGEIQAAYMKLYNEQLPDNLVLQMEQFCNMDAKTLRENYKKQNRAEEEMGSQITSYIDDGVNINAKNVEDVIARIKEKMKQ